MRWLIKSAISLFIGSKEAKKALKDEYKKLKDDNFYPVDPTSSYQQIYFYPSLTIRNTFTYFNNWPSFDVTISSPLGKIVFVKKILSVRIAQMNGINGVNLVLFLQF
jgi:hypothetical protein